MVCFRGTQIMFLLIDPRVNIRFLQYAFRHHFNMFTPNPSIITPFVPISLLTIQNIDVFKFQIPTVAVFVGDFISH